MRNKVELKKAILWSICAMILLNIAFGLINYYEYKKYTDNFNSKIAMIITKLGEEYQNIKKNDIMGILNSDELKDSNLLEDYGIDLNKDSLILQNDVYFKRFLVTNVIILSILGLVILAIFLKYNYSKDRKLDEITRYIEEINNKNYKLDIADNSEDELSILKNELYKITIMLKETAENSVKDKLFLKDSLSDISHQLKTPLTSISILLDNILENPEMDEKSKNEFLIDIKREIININFLINSLLKISKLDSETVKFINKEESIGHILNESVKNVETLCDLKNIKIEIEGNMESKLYCDAKWQIEAITNILKNAVEHSYENSKIEVFFEQNKVYSRIEIIDYGTGINQEDLPHIFERFYKAKNSSSDSVGIGLALSKSIIEKNNGYVDVQSKVGKGTKFIIKYFA